MSGHSKWASIKHKKGALDAKRGRIFTKVIKEITIAAKMGGGDIESNPRLRAAVLKAKAANMPKDNIDRAIKKGTGDLDGAVYSELVYEGYGPSGVALLIETLTDNKNRTAAEVKSVLSKHNGALGTSGCVSYMFKRKGILTIEGDNLDGDMLFELALDAGADDVLIEEGVVEIYTTPESFESVYNALQAKGISTSMAEVTMVPDTKIELDAETSEKVERLIERLEDLDDVQNVSTNMEDSGAEE